MHYQQLIALSKDPQVMCTGEITTSIRSVVQHPICTGELVGSVTLMDPQAARTGELAASVREVDQQATCLGELPTPSNTSINPQAVCNLHVLLS